MMELEVDVDRTQAIYPMILPFAMRLTVAAWGERKMGEEGYLLDLR